MEKIYLAVCDDDADILAVVSGAIRNAFRRHQIDAYVELFKSTRLLRLRMTERDFDLLFLDIEMPGEDGISFARSLRATNSRTDVIFISNREDLVFDALRTNPGGFIRKSRFLEDTSAVIDQWIKEHPREKRVSLVIQSGGDTTILPLDKILYIEGQGKYQEIYLTDSQQPVEVRKSMQEMEDYLKDSGFLRVHKGYLVNCRYIRRLDSAEAILTNKARIPLSRRRLQEIRDEYMRQMRGSENILL